MSTIFGLDFGTSNSALTVNEGGVVRVIDIDPFNPSSKTLRSVMYFPGGKKRNFFVGQEAITRYIEDDATGRFMQSIKTYLASQVFETTVINGNPYHLEDLIAIMLRIIKQRGESCLQKEVNEVVLGRPVVFSDNPEGEKLAEGRLLSAAEKAGFKHVRFQFEPVAAALAFEDTLSSGEEKRVLVGDFGGGTSDFTTILLRGGNRSIDRKTDILSLAGVSIAGDMFDSRIMKGLVPYFGSEAKCKTMTGQWLDVPAHIFLTLCQWHLIPQLREKNQRDIIRQIRARSDQPEVLERLEDLIDQNYGFKLFQSIEKTKCELSSRTDSNVVFREGLTDINKKIVRTEFEKMIEEEIRRIKECVDQCLRDSALNSSEIDAVFLTGGSSFVPCVNEIFVKKFGADKIRRGDAFTSVAYGLGLSASHF